MSGKLGSLFWQECKGSRYFKAAPVPDSTFISNAFVKDAEMSSIDTGIRFPFVNLQQSWLV